MKLTVIGGGGVRSLFLAKSIAQKAESLRITELVFMDNDEEKLRIYGSLAQEVSKRIAPKLGFVLSKDSVEAVRDADYIITTIRAGGDHMRVLDERIALSHGLLGQETTGAAGFSFAMRSIPALLEYCKLIKLYAKPEVKVFNFTNPAGVVSQALRDMGYDFCYGICDAPSGMLHQFAKLYDVDAHSVSGECYGLNHLSFFSSIKIEGREVLSELIDRDDAYLKTDMRFFEKELLQNMGMILNEYLYYFFYREQAVEHILHTVQTRGESIAYINQQMTKELSGLDVHQDFEKCIQCFEKWYALRENAYMSAETGIHRDKPWSFDLNSPDNGGYAGVALKFMEIMQENRKGTMILCTPNQGAIPYLKDEDVVEITCEISQEGVKPHRILQADERALSLIRRVKEYERLASRAICKRSIQDAVDGLFAHPLVASYSLAKKLVEQYLILNAEYCHGWK